MIGFWHNPVVGPSARLSIMLCIVTPRVGEQG